MRNKYYITTAIDYVNSPPHIGTAYEKISADVFARFRRLIGDDVYFQMGSDEHSLNVLRSAKLRGLDPLVYCDEMEQVFRRVWEKLEISFDRFIRTTEPDHVTGLRKLFRAIEHDIYRGHYEGFYCESCEAFLQEKDLADGKCPTHGTRPEWIKEENYFFRLSRYGDRLLAHIEENPDFILPETRRNEIVQLIRSGLDDISVTRAGTDWGVPLPLDESQVIYVWADALSNYATGAGYGYDDDRFAKWWPADVHVIGKDITRFHCVIWPAMLMSAGVELPRTVYGHGFVYFKGQRLSKSRGVTVDPLEAADVFGPSALRYFLMREGTYGRDVDFTWEQFRSRYDSELANDLGNLVSRATAMIGRFLDGRVNGVPGLRNGGSDGLAELAGSTREAVTESMNAFAPQAALAAIWELVRRANTYIEERKPWVLAREDPGSVGRVLFNVMEAIRQIATLAWPVIPGKSEEILKALGLTLEPGAASLEDLLAWGATWPDTIEIARSDAIFPKYTDEELANRHGIAVSVPGEDVESGARIASDDIGGPNDSGDSVATGGSAGDASVPEGGDTKMLSFERFKELDLRLARIVDAARVDGTTKLVRMTVDLGSGDTRQMVAGIAEGYPAPDLIGKTVVVVANLEPAKIRGIESQAMLLAAVGDGKIALVGPDKDLPAGTRVS
ncbi:MAG: methionine--tRNA ligase [Candidatus Eisenbacteria bacterium]|nr:methionine--tRNA ligase [Candidatus Eisenbacteria bacterium]